MRLLLVVTSILLIACDRPAEVQEASAGTAGPATTATLTLRAHGPAGVAVTGKPSEEGVLRLVNEDQRGQSWTVFAYGEAPLVVKPGEVVHFSLKGRTVWSDYESRRAEVRLGLSLVDDRGRDHGLYGQTIPFSETWMDFAMPVVVAPGKQGSRVKLKLEIGMRPQTVEVKDIVVRVHPAGTDPATLPRYRYTWPGRELDAPWRKAADERIAKHRKATLRVAVVDADGKGVPGASVRARMTRHAFAFGTMVPYFYLQGSSPGRRGWNDFQDAPWIARYHHELVANFNCAVNGLILKWPQLERFGEENAEEYLRALRVLGLETRGHCLIWPKWQFIHRSIRALENDPPALRAAVEKRVRETTRRFAPLVDEWDVLNEPVTRTDLQRILGEGILVDIFKWAHEEDPTARLYVNNFGTLTGVYDDAMADGYARIIERLQAAKAPLGGIGLQGHMAGDVTPPEEVLKILDRFGKYGLPIRITEYSHGSPNQDEIDDYFRDLLTACFSHPAVDGFIFWGFVGKHTTPMFDEAWNLTGVGRHWRDLVYGRWWTDASLTAGADGVATVDGFLGDYEVEVTAGDGRTAAVPARLVHEGSAVEVVLH